MTKQNIDLVIIGNTFFSREKTNIPLIRVDKVDTHLWQKDFNVNSYLNEPVPSYKNLAPEDCERIIELSATDVGPVGYDSLNGWGRLNAGKALRLVEKPFRTVHHFGTNQYSQFTKESTLESSQQVVYLKEQIQNANGEWFPKGEYKVNAYRIDAVVEQDLPQEDSILYFWARPSMSTVFEPIKNDSLLPRERIAIDSSSFTQNSCSMSGYVYEMFDTSGNPLGWLPFDTTLSKAQFEYTILTKQFYNVGIQDEQLNDVVNWAHLFPNPTTGEQQLIITTQGNTPISVDLYGVDGKLIRKIYHGATTNQETVISINIEHLSAGMYFYQVIAGEKNQSIKFIKQ